MNKKVLSLLLVLILPAVILTGCKAGVNSQQTETQTQTETDKASDSKRLKIVCTLFPQYDFVRSIVGERADVTLLLPPGADSHSYEPTPADMITVASADLFVYIGDEMESWAHSIIKTIKGGDVAILNVSQALGLKLEVHKHEHDQEQHGHGEEESVDPHIWTNPVFAAQMVDIISSSICGLDEGNSIFFKDNADKYRYEILKLSNEFRDIVSKAEIKKIYFADEFALSAFAEEYGLEHLAAFDSCGENAEASASKIAQIIDEIHKNKIPVIFYPELTVSKEAKLISSETGARMLQFHSCHNISSADFAAGETYISLMKANAENLSIALGLAK